MFISGGGVLGHLELKDLYDLSDAILIDDIFVVKRDEFLNAVEVLEELLVRQ